MKGPRKDTHCFIGHQCIGSFSWFENWSLTLYTFTVHIKTLIYRTDTCKLPKWFCPDWPGASMCVCPLMKAPRPSSYNGRCLKELVKCVQWFAAVPSHWVSRVWVSFASHLFAVNFKSFTCDATSSKKCGLRMPSGGTMIKNNECVHVLMAVVMSLCL